MNNDRLSTSGNPKIDRAKILSDLESILAMPSNYELRADGRILIISEGRFLSSGKRVGIQLISVEGGTVINTFKSITACIKFLHLGQATVMSKLETGEPVLFENQLCVLKRANISVNGEGTKLDVSLDNPIVLNSSLFPGVASYLRRLGKRISQSLSQAITTGFNRLKASCRKVLTLGGHTTKVLDKGSIEIVGPLGL